MNNTEKFCQNGLVDVVFDINLVEEDDSYQSIQYEDLPSVYRHELDQFASELFDRDLGRIVVVGSSQSGKTFLIHQLVGNIDRYLDRLNMNDMVFVRIGEDDFEKIMRLPNTYSDYIQNLCQELRKKEHEICFVTEEPYIASKLYSFTKKARLILESSPSTLMHLMNNESQGSTKIWNSWGIIDVDEILLKRKDIVDLVYLILHERVEENFKIDLTKKTISSFVQHVIKRMPGMVLPDNYITVPVGVWTIAIRRMCGVIGLSESAQLRHNDKIMMSRVIENVYQDNKDFFENYVPHDDDDERMIIVNTPFGPAQLSLQDKLSEMLGNDDDELDSQIDVEKLEFKNIDELNSILKKEIMGQDEAIDALTEGLVVSAAGLHDDSKPLRSLMFLGPTGVGKTKLATTLAENIAEKPMNVVRIDMSEYSQPHEAAKLLGAPPGYAGFEKGGVLTNAVKQHPQSLILLDEIEKAHPKIWDSFLQIFDAGRMTDGTGNTIDFTQTIIIMTSNIGAQELKRKSIGFNFLSDEDAWKQRQEDAQEIIIKAVEQEFRPELVNRIDEIIVFKELSHETARNIVRKELGIVSDRMRHHGFELAEVSNDIIDELLVKSDVSKYGAREIQRVILKNISHVIARMMVNNISQEKQEISLMLDDNKKISIV